jgi:hypothetical protein
MKPVAPPPGVKTAWTDPEHVRLTQPEPWERVEGRHSERLHGPDPDDPWATPAPQCSCEDPWPDENCPVHGRTPF